MTADEVGAFRFPLVEKNVIAQATGGPRQRLRDLLQDSMPRVSPSP